MKDKDYEDNLDSIRDENKFLRLKLMLERGMELTEFEKSKMNPKMENVFLKNIEVFERIFDDKSEKRIPLLEFLDKPILLKADSIPDSEIEDELKKLTELMNQNQVFLDTICPVETRTLYKFITEELMHQEVDDVRIDGMTNHFIYEEFHPNHNHDIREHTTDFVSSFFEKQKDYYLNLLTKEAEQNMELTNFRDAYSSFKINYFEIMSVWHNNSDAEVNFKIDLRAQIEGCTENYLYSGDGTVKLKYVYDYWCIDKLQLPKME